MKSEIWLAVLALTLVGIVFSLPLISNFNSAIPYSLRPATGFETVNMMQGDHLQFFYTLTQFGDYFRQGNSAFFREPYEFTAPFLERPYSSRELPLSVLFFALSPLGNIAAYNILVILSFVASGLSVFLLCGRYLKSFLPRLISSILFAIFPFRLAQLYGGHPNGFLVFLLPLMLYGYDAWIETGRWRYAIVSGVCIVSMAVEELHLAYFSALFTAAFLVYKGVSGFIREKAERRKVFRRFMRLALVIVIFWALASGYIMYVKQAAFEPSRADAGREISEIKLFAPQAGDFLRRVNNNSERFIYPGIVSILLGLFAFGRRGGRKVRWFYLALFIICAVLSLGPNLRAFPLYNFFYRFVPFFNYPRSTARIIVFAFLSLSVLSGFGAENIIKVRYGGLIAVVAIAAMMVDFHPLGRIGLCKLSKGNEVYEYVNHVRKKPSNGAKERKGVILEIPLWPGDSAWSSIYEYYATLYHIPMVNGYSSFVTRDYIENVFWPLASVNMGCLNRDQLELLRTMNVRYIILHEEAYPQKVSPFPFKTTLSNMKGSPFVEFVKQDGPLYLFELKRDIALDYVQYSVPSKMGVFYECEHLLSQAGSISFDVDASGGRARYAGEADNGYLAFGPYQLFPPGRYRVVFRIKGSKDSVRIDVASDKGEEVITSRRIRGRAAGGYSDYELNFAISGLSELEFRIEVCGDGEVWADYVYLTFQGEEDPLTKLEAEDMFHTGREIRDARASGGAAVYGDPLIDPPDKLVFGGSRRYARGSYIASFRLKTAQCAREPVAAARVLLSGSGIILAESEICGTDLEEPGRYQDVELPFSLNKSQALDFEIVFKKRSGLWVDKIEIGRVTPTSPPPSRGRIKERVR